MIESRGKHSSQSPLTYEPNNSYCHVSAEGICCCNMHMGGIKDMGQSAVRELMIEWINPFFNKLELDRVVGWQLDSNFDDLHWV